MTSERKCNYCGIFKHIKEFVYAQGTQCKVCFTTKNKAKSYKYYAIHKDDPAYRRKRAMIQRQYRLSLKGRITSGRWKREWVKTPQGRANALKCLFRFIDRHPFYNLEYLERFIRIAEGTFSLDAAGNDSNFYEILGKGLDKRENNIVMQF